MVGGRHGTRASWGGSLLPAATQAVRESPKGSECGQYEADPAMLAASIVGHELEKSRQSFTSLSGSMPFAKRA